MKRHPNTLPNVAPRRHVLALAGAACGASVPWWLTAHAQPTAASASASAAAASAPPAAPSTTIGEPGRGALNLQVDRLHVLYKPAGAHSPHRLDPAVQQALRSLEAAWLQQGFKVMQPSADVLGVMDRGESVVVTFAADAGLSLVLSAYVDTRPVPQQQGAIAEVRLDGRVLLAHHVLAVTAGRGQMYTRLGDGVDDFGRRRAIELAATKAAQQLVDDAAPRIRALTPASLTALLGDRPLRQTVAHAVAVPNGDSTATAPQAPSRPSVPAAAAAPAGAVAASPAAATPPSSAPAASSTAPPASAAVPPPATPLAPPQKRWALLVGISNYGFMRRDGQNQPSDLPGVAKDVPNVARTLSSLGFESPRVATLMDEKATGAAVRGALKELAGLVGPDDLVVLFLSAHGGPKSMSASGHGAPLLADYRHGDANSLDFWELQALCTNLRGRVVWIIDTCFSGGATQHLQQLEVTADGTRMVPVQRGPDALEVARRGRSGQDFAILTASSPHETSFDTSEGGLFTKQLMAAMRRHGERTLSSVFSQEVFAQVVRDSRNICARRSDCSQPQQTPMMAYGGHGDRIRM